MSEISLRDRKRLGAMQRVQKTAVDLFGKDGFDGVTVEQVAAAADVAPISVYRWFGSKENLVLWDDYDPALFEAIGAQLQIHAPLDAVRAALTVELDRIYDADRSIVLDRARLIASENALMAASAANSALMGDALAALFDTADPDGDAFEHRILAVVVVSVLTASVLEWTRLAAEVPLARLIDRGFETLREASWDT